MQIRSNLVPSWAWMVVDTWLVQISLLFGGPQPVFTIISMYCISAHLLLSIPIRYSPIEGSLALSNGLIAGNALGGTGWCLFVYNLAPETEESTLWQLFGPFGAVQNVKVSRISDLHQQTTMAHGTCHAISTFSVSDHDSIVHHIF